MKYFFGFLATVAAIVVVILLTINLFKNLDEPTADSSVVSAYDLKSDGANDSVARYIVSGAIGAEENYREIRITVSKSARTVEVVRGYSGAVEKTATLPNTLDAYRAFIGSLEAADFDATQPTDNQPRYTCVTGNRFYYQLQVGSEKKIDTWSTTCGVGQGSFAGSVEGTRTLFQNQIPNYNEFVSGVNLGLR